MKNTMSYKKIQKKYLKLLNKEHFNKQIETVNENQTNSGIKTLNN